MSGVFRALAALCVGLTLLLGTTACSKPSGDGGSGSGAISSSTAAGKDVPKRVTDTLAHIDADDWPDAAHAPGTHGGDPFGNREGRLPKQDGKGAKVTYTEWEVNPKKAGRGRDAERIITGSDGSAWFTLDHYGTFSRIR